MRGFQLFIHYPYVCNLRHGISRSCFNPATELAGLFLLFFSLQAVSTVEWHRKGDYFTTVVPSDILDISSTDIIIIVSLFWFSILLMHKYMAILDWLGKLGLCYFY